MKDTAGNFRLIAIQPHLDCDQKFTKVLMPGKLYQFYSEFEFFNSDGTKVNDGETIISYKKTASEVPEDLYNIDNLNVNVAAIVGKNGSGKSSLIELLLYSIYKLGITIEDKNKKKILRTYAEQAREDIRIIDLEIEYNTHTLEVIEKILNSNDERNSDFKEKLEEFADLKENIKELKVKKDFLSKTVPASEHENLYIILNLKCSVFFEIDHVVWKLSTDNSSDVNIEIVQSDENKISAETRNVQIFNVTDPDSYEILSSFFYTMVLNYSHHGLNSSYLGFWVTTLFHKNDGYKAPAVINPMRTEGNFDINTENDLARSRLLMNLLIEALHHREAPKKIKLTDCKSSAKSGLI